MLKMKKGPVWCRVYKNKEKGWKLKPSKFTSTPKKIMKKNHHKIHL